MIDMHSHFYGEALCAHLARRADVPRVVTHDGRRFMETPTSRFEVRGGFVSLDDRLAWMDSLGIERQLMTFPGALGPDVFSPAEAVPLVRDVNDELAAACVAHPRRFVGLAGLPLADLDAAIAEFERARRIGHIGFILPSNYAATLGHLDALTPLFEAADRIGGHVMLHPGLRADEDFAPRAWADLAMHRASSIELHGGIAHALTSLIHARLPSRFPRLTFQVVNLGGTFPILVERMDHIVATRDPAAPRPSEMLDGIFVDNASLGPRALALAIDVFGADRVMLGTDYPIFSTSVATDALAGTPARDAIATGTAAALLARHGAGPA